MWTWFKSTVGIIVLISILSIGLTAGGLYMKRYWYSLERQAVKQSLPYQEGKTSQIMQLMQEYHDSDATETQKKFLLVRIKIEAERVGIKNVPEDVQVLIRSITR